MNDEAVRVLQWFFWYTKDCSWSVPSSHWQCYECGNSLVTVLWYELVANGGEVPGWKWRETYLRHEGIIASAVLKTGTASISAWVRKQRTVVYTYRNSITWHCVNRGSARVFLYMYVIFLFQVYSSFKVLLFGIQYLFGVQYLFCVYFIILNSKKYCIRGYCYFTRLFLSSK